LSNKRKQIKIGGLPMKKALMIIMVVIMILGIAFSISNLISMELKASSLRGAWVGTDCMGDGNDCAIGIEEPV
jgi:hypothetical protein